MAHKVKVHIKSMEFKPRKGGEYRAGSVQILDPDEAKELSEAGICSIIEDPYMVPDEPGIPYLQEEPSEAEIAAKLASEKDAKIDAEIEAMLAKEKLEESQGPGELEGYESDHDNDEE